MILIWMRNMYTWIQWKWKLDSKLSSEVPSNEGIIYQAQHYIAIKCSGRETIQSWKLGVNA